MQTGNRRPIGGPDDLDIISAIWMLACTDRDTIITYRGIAYRLQLDGWDAAEGSEALERATERVKNLVRSRAELFSPVVASQWLEDWKSWVTADRHFPGWALETAKPDRDKLIEGLKVEDVFRCQFRTDDLRLTGGPIPNPCTPPCTPDQVKLGLEHIDRLRKAGAEAREERLKFWLPALALGVTALTALASSFIAWRSLESGLQTAQQTGVLAATEAEIKLWDLASRERGDAYESWLDGMQLAFDAASHGDEAQMEKQLTRMRLNLFKLEPLIEKPDSRKSLWDQHKEFEAFCAERLVASRQVAAPDLPAALKKFDDLREAMHKRLYHLLFDKGPQEFNPLEALGRLGIR
jgi:hypothetical protein